MVDDEDFGAGKQGLKGAAEAESVIVSVDEGGDRGHEYRAFESKGNLPRSERVRKIISNHVRTLKVHQGNHGHRYSVARMR